MDGDESARQSVKSGSRRKKPLEEELQKKEEAPVMGFLVRLMKIAKI
jgi:hypothetical protein